MSDVSQGPGWWQASDGNWYPPADAEQPGPGWWLASDGNWYPPEQRTTSTASDPAGRTPVKPIAKPAAPSAGAAATTRPVTAAMGTPPGPAVAPLPPGTGATTKAAKPVLKQPTGAAATTAGATAKPGAAPLKPGTATKPAATAAPKGPDAAPVTSPAGPRATGSAPDPAPTTIAAALSPDEQIRARNEQSRRDATVLFGARKDAATRALGNISALLDQERSVPPRELRESGPARAAAGRPTPPSVDSPPAPTPSTPPEPKSKGKVGRVVKAGWSAASHAAGTPAANPPPPATAGRDTEAPTIIAAGHTEQPAPSEPPLLEVKQGTLAADIEHIGERLVIFNDRVELHDRADRVRQVIAGADIADVVVHKKFTGSTVTIEAGSGESIVAKGLKPEQADEIRAVILKRTRAGAPSGAIAMAPARPEPSSSPWSARTDDETIVDARDPRPEPSERGHDADGADLLAKLEDLHRAGVLTDSELAEKKALVERLVRGETFAAAPSA